jgi:hypothetical protein
MLEPTPATTGSATKAARLTGRKKLSDLTGLTNSGRMIQKGVIGD